MVAVRFVLTGQADGASEFGGGLDDDPDPGDIAYYAPGRSLVVYYGRVGAWPGLYRIGRFDLEPSLLAQLPDGTGVDLSVVTS